MRERLAIWGEQKKGLKAREKLIKKERIVDWFAKEAKDKRGKDRMQQELAEMAERKKEEERELKLRKKYKGSYPEGKSQGGERSGKRRNRAITRETKGARAPHR